MHLKEIFAYADSTEPCLSHLRTMSDKIGMHPVFENGAEMMSNLEDIYNIMEEKDSLRAAWIHPATRNYFTITPEIEKYFEKVLTFGRFRGRKGKEMSELQPIRSEEELSFKQEFTDDGAVLLPDIFQWMNESQKFHEEIQQNINMYLHHCRDEQHNSESKLVLNSHFSLLSFVVACDPIIYSYMLKISSATRFMALPQPIRIIKQADFEGPVTEIMADLEVSPQIFGELVWGGSNSLSMVRIEDKESFGECLRLSGDVSGSYVIDTERLNGLPTSKVKTCQIAVGNMRVCLRDQGTILESFSNDSNQDRVSIPLGLIPLDQVGELIHPVLKKEDVKVAWNTLRLPEFDLYGARNDFRNGRFDCAIGLGSMGYLSMALLGQMPWTHRLVQEDAEFWAGFSPESAEHMQKYREHQEQVKRAVERIAADIQKMETWCYEDKSYFAAGGKDVGPAEPEVIVLSDDDSSGLENSGVTATPKRRKRTAGENEDDKDGSPSKKAKV